jgi:regulator of sirC expression with transglutaminase-like and TPR domain
MILEARGDRAGAAAEYRAFLQHAPKSPEAESVKARLAALTL